MTAGVGPGICFSHTCVSGVVMAEYAERMQGLGVQFPGSNAVMPP